MPTEFFTPPEDAVSPDEIRIRRREALEHAKDNGVLTLRAEEGRWLGHEARVAVETGTHEIPDVAARRVAEAQAHGQEAAAEQHNGHVAA